MSDIERFPKSTHKYLKQIPKADRKALLKEYGHLGEWAAPGIIFDIYLKRKYEAKNLTEIRKDAKKFGVYTIWTDGSQKTKPDLINSLLLYHDDPKGFLRKQTALMGKTEPKIAKKITVSEMSDAQRSLNRLKTDALKDLCKKHKIPCVGKKIDVIDKLIEELDEDEIEEVTADLKASPKRSRSASPKKSSKKPSKKRSTSPPKRSRSVSPKKKPSKKRSISPPKKLRSVSPKKSKVSQGKSKDEKIRDCLRKMDKLRLLTFCNKKSIPCTVSMDKERIIKAIMRWNLTK